MYVAQKISFPSNKVTRDHQRYYSVQEKQYNLRTIVIEKGTKRIRVKDHPAIKKNIQTDRVQKLVCNTCNEEIGSDICKVLVMRDKDDNPQISHYHFFYPCWNFELLCRRYPNLTLDRVGVSIPENIFMTENTIVDLQNNLEFWE